MAVYIQGAGSISPQGTHDEEQFLDPVRSYETSLMRCVEPDHKTFIPGKLARRMSRLVKMGVSSATLSLQRAGVERPDAILAGTGLGCMEETEKFLLSMIEQKEQMLHPTAFIQSTHNSIAGQLAISLGCKGYNHTYVHRALSFPSAVLDATLLIREGEASNVLVGGFDEMTDHNFFISKKLGLWKEDPVKNLELHDHGTSGSIAGEGAHFFLLAPERGPSTLASLDGVEFFYKVEGQEAYEKRVEAFLEKNGLLPGDIDAVILGLSGDRETDKGLRDLHRSLLPESDALHYKALSGEHHTACAFAVWTAARVLHEGVIPDPLRLEKGRKEGAAPERILVCDHYFGNDHSLFLLSR